MVNNRSTQELSAILAILGTHTDGIGIAVIARQLGPLINRRTIQRRLEHLIKNGQVMTYGKSVSLVYKLSEKKLVSGVSDVLETITERDVDTELYVPVSVEGSLIRDQVRRPLMHRRPIGYQRTFLEAYKPGEQTSSKRRSAHIRTSLDRNDCTITRR